MAHKPMRGLEGEGNRCDETTGHSAWLAPLALSPAAVAGPVYCTCRPRLVLGAAFRAGARGRAYGARIGCSCHFVGGRPLDQCRDDFMPGMSLVMLSQDDEEKSVTARVFPIASETVFYRKGEGCLFTPKH
jgi:hypothetical protein